MAKKRRTWEEQIRVDQQMYYDDRHTVQVKLKLNKKTDSDIIEWAEKVKKRYLSKTTLQGEIKRLIRQEISQNQTQ